MTDWRPPHQQTQPINTTFRARHCSCWHGRSVAAQQSHFQNQVHSDVCLVGNRSAQVKIFGLSGALHCKSSTICIPRQPKWVTHMTPLLLLLSALLPPSHIIYLFSLPLMSFSLPTPLINTRGELWEMSFSFPGREACRPTEVHTCVLALRKSGKCSTRNVMFRLHSSTLTTAEACQPRFR